jgi:bifunctional non-homologous end joining protein LigD
MRLHIHSTGAHGAAASRALADQMSDAMAEGIVSKRKGSPYRSGRSPDWLKMKNPRRRQ